MSKEQEEVHMNNVKWLKPLINKETNKNVWIANKTVRVFLQNSSVPWEKKREENRKKRNRHK